MRLVLDPPRLQSAGGERRLNSCGVASMKAVKLTRTQMGIALFAGIAMSAGPAWAVPIAVNNFSFESPEEGNSGASTTCPTSWTCNPAANGTFNVGVFSPVSPSQYKNNGTDGLAAGHTVPNDGTARTNASNTSGGYEALY